MSILEDNNEKIADKTFNKITSAIGSNNDSTMINMFSNTVKAKLIYQYSY